MNCLFLGDFFLCPGEVNNSDETKLNDNRDDNLLTYNERETGANTVQSTLAR